MPYQLSEEEYLSALIYAIDKEEIVDDLWDDADQYGLLIPWSTIPDLTSDAIEGYEWLAEKFLDEERIEQLRQGSEPTEDESQSWEETYIEYIQEAPDADYHPGFGIKAVEVPGGSLYYALVTTRGYSFTTIERKLEGVFSSVEDALKYLRDMGLVFQT